MKRTHQWIIEALKDGDKDIYGIMVYIRNRGKGKRGRKPITNMGSGTSLSAVMCKKTNIFEKKTEGYYANNRYIPCIWGLKKGYEAYLGDSK